MSTAELEQRQEQLRQCLARLARRQGARQAKLAAFLNQELLPLRNALGVNTNSDDLAQGSIRGLLKARIGTFDIPKETAIPSVMRRKMFETAFLVGFNIGPWPVLEKRNLDERREFLETYGVRYQGEVIRVNISMSRRDLKDAIAQIAAHLTSPDYKPVIVPPEPNTGIEPEPQPGPSVLVEPDIQPESDATVEEVVSVSAFAPESLAKHPLRITRTVTIAAAAIAILIAGIILWPIEKPVPPVEPLQVTGLGQSDGGHGWSVVFPADRPDAIREFVARTDDGRLMDSFHGRGPENTFLDDALDAGGYIPGRALIFVSLENRTDRVLTVFSMRIKPTEDRAPLPTGAVILFPQGADADPYRKLRFELDRLNPVALDVQGTKAGDPAFGDKPFELQPGQKGVVEIIAEAKTRVHVFNIAIDYEVAGEKHEYILTRSKDENGPPFRVAGSLCNDGKEVLRPEERATLPVEPYGVIRTVGWGSRELVPGTEATYQEQCDF